MLPISSQSSPSSYSLLYDLIVPKDNLLRKINDLIDFTFIYEELQNKYCQTNGRISPESYSPLQIFIVEEYPLRWSDLIFQMLMW